MQRFDHRPPSLSPEDAGQPEQLEYRVTRLENRLVDAERGRRRATLVALLLGFGVALLGASQAAGRVTETGALVIRDDAGTVRAQLGVGEEGSALGLFDERGFLRAGLAAAPDGPILNLFGADGSPRLVAGARDTGAFVVLRDLEGAPRAAMAIQAGGTPSLYLLDEDLSLLWRAPGPDPEGSRRF